MEVTLPISNIIIIAISSVGILLSQILGIIFFVQKRNRHLSNTILGCLLLLTGLTLLNDMLTVSSITNKFKNLYFIPIFYSLSIGPLFYLFVKSKYYNTIRKYDYLHLVIPVIQAIIYFTIGFRSIEYKTNLWENTSFPVYLGIESFLFPFSLIIYSILSRFLLTNAPTTDYFWNKDLQRWLLGFANGFIAIAIMEFFLSIGDYGWGYSFSSLFFILRSCTFVVFILWVSYHGIKLIFPTFIYSSKPNNSTLLLAQESLSDYTKELVRLMEEDRIYLNSDLNLQILAQYLQTSEKICSHILSKGFQSNFNQFVNNYRIEAFKEKVIAGQHEAFTLLSLAYECGFESKSTFNRAFKLSTNSTPTQFVKSIQNSKK